MGQYNKIQYWGTRDNPNNKEGDAAAERHISGIKNFIEDNINILDYGPGIGRMTMLYSNQSGITFYDISENYKNRLEEKCKNEGLKIYDYIIDTSEKIETPFKDSEFDLVCAFEVLLHCPEDEVTDVLTELARIGKKVMVVTWFTNNTQNIGHCWTRDYKQILTENNMTIHHWDEQVFDRQVFFIYGK